MDKNEKQNYELEEPKQLKPNWTEEQWKSWNDAIEKIKLEALLIQKQSNVNVGWM